LNPKKEDNQMKITKAITGVLVLTTILAIAFSAEAMGPGRYHHGGGLFGLKAVLQLNLTDAQRTQILSIFAKYDIKTAWTNLREARNTLRTSLSQATSEDSIDGIVSAYLTTVAPLQQQLLSTRAKMIYEIKGVLTPEQLQMLQQHKKGAQSGSPTTTNP
jgi:Spy/CpxP family protein refolding chaperone